MKPGDLIRYKMDFGGGGHSTAPWSAPYLVVKIAPHYAFHKPGDPPPTWVVKGEGRTLTLNATWNVVQILIDGEWRLDEEIQI